MNTIRRIATLGAVVATTATGLGVAAAPAQAITSWNGCTYPNVCVYNREHGVKTAQFRDITSYYQNTTPRNEWMVLNTRNDDTVWVRYVQGGRTKYACMRPNHGLIGHLSDGMRLTGIKISDRATC